VNSAWFRKRAKWMARTDARLLKIAALKSRQQINEISFEMTTPLVLEMSLTNACTFFPEVGKV
jgi:hypothetical protein